MNGYLALLALIIAFFMGFLAIDWGLHEGQPVPPAKHVTTRP